jgi:hypothetical protein
MINCRNGLKVAIAILAIGLIAAFAGCTSSTGSDNTNISATNAATAVVTAAPAGGNGTPILISWFGSVTDSFGKPFEGVNVTLHLMTPAGEAYNMSTRSYVGMPYPGTYVFDNVEVTPDITYAYAQAMGDVGDGVQYYGRTDNFTLNKSRISTGFIVMHVPMPDAVNVTPEHSSISATGRQGSPSSTQVTAQLYLNGKPYKRAGQTVNFTVDNEAVGKLQAASNATDEEGRATILLTGVGPGNVNITGYMKVGISRNLTNTCTVQVTG